MPLTRNQRVAKARTERKRRPASNTVPTRIGEKSSEIRVGMNREGPALFVSFGGKTYSTVLNYEGVDREPKDITVKTLKVKDIKSLGRSGVGNFNKIVINNKAQVSTGLGFLMNNDSVGYNQLALGGANTEILLGYDGGGSSPNSNIDGSSKIIMNRSAANDVTCTIHFRDNNTSQFVMGGSGDENEWRVATGDDARTEANCAIRVNTSGHIAFRGQTPAAWPNWAVSNKSGTSRVLDANGSLADIGDRLAQLVDDLISIGILQ